jgi:hypothetical protein
VQAVSTDVDACVIAGSLCAIEEYVAEVYGAAASRVTIKKTRFGEILQGLELGAAYAFDKESYARFYPLALEAGLRYRQRTLTTHATRGRGSSR